MVRLMPRILVPSVLGLLASAAPVLAQGRSDFVNDEAAFFSRDAKAKSDSQIAAMKARVKHELVVDTVVSVTVPPEINSKNSDAVNRFFDNWADNRFSQEKINGVYVVIVQNPPKVRVRLGNKTEQSGLFKTVDRKELENVLIANLKAAHKEAMKNQEKNDKVLSGAVEFVQARMNQHFNQLHVPAGNRSQFPAGQQPQRQPGGTPWMTYILIGIGVLLVIWLVKGLARGMSGGMSPGMGGGGGGGGGFLSSMMGGLFGAAAGMWLYNNFLGGHSSSWGAGNDGGNYGNDASGNDVDTGSTGGGGDYDSGSSGDQGGGSDGGDWGGGGGDFGGGGGDFGGGGGGGDW